MCSAMADELTHEWPKWLTPEYTAIHTTIYNEIIRALQHCVDSADAAGMDYTSDGFYSVTASNIVGLMRRWGTPAPKNLGRVERRKVEYRDSDWDYDDELQPRVTQYIFDNGTDQPDPSRVIQVFHVKGNDWLIAKGRDPINPLWVYHESDEWLQRPRDGDREKCYRTENEAIEEAQYLAREILTAN